MNILRHISRFIVGTVFIFSGTVKAIDPLGSAYKFQDYFQAFGLGFLESMGLILAIVLCTTEFLAGFAVLFNIRAKTGIWVIMIMMLLFTPLTFILALTNPVSDCGCFGDAIHLTNWQTFGKNIILFIPVLYLFFTRGKNNSAGSRLRDWSVLILFALLFIVFISYNLKYLPVIDFLPYSKGTHIPDKLIIPEGKPSDKYETTFIYQKDGQNREFTLETYPADDTTWKFIEQRSVLVSKGYQPPIHDLSFTSINNEDLTQKILTSETPVMLMIVNKLEKVKPELLRKGFELGNYCQSNLIDFYVLTSSGSDIVGNYANGLSFCLADEITLKTMVRATPGYILLQKGTITGKWSWANLPEARKIKEMLNNQ